MRKRHKNITIWVLFISIVPVAFYLYNCETRTKISDDLWGVWTTSEPRYKDRSFEITKDLIILGTGVASGDSCSIKKIEKEDQGTKRLYVIYYDTSEGDEQQFSFYYSTKKGGTIRLKNQKDIVWKRL